MRNGTYVNFSYLAGYKWPGVTDDQAVINSVEVQKNLFKNFNFAIQVATATTEWAYFGDTTKFSGAWIKLANQNPTVPTTINTAWPHVRPTDIGYKEKESYTTAKTLPNSSYLQNSSGQFLTLNGSTTTTDKILAPDAPVDSIIIDAKTQRFAFTKLFQKLTRPLDFINDEWENLPMYNTGHTGPPMDASVLADKNASGWDWYTYYGKRFTHFCKVYVDTMMTLPQLANTKIQFYESEGHDFYRQKYSETRTIQTPINGKNYPVPSIYTRYPYNWRTGFSAWNGWKWYSEARANELSYGDSYCTPAVAAGWDSLEQNNIRPGQWLGLCKSLAMAGGENFFPAFFVLGGTALQNPRNYVWQVVVPAYAQAITTRYEDLFRYGYVMQGDFPLDPANPTGPKAYSFLSGDQRKLVVVRKSNTVNKYAITGTFQPSSNMVGNTPLEGVAHITLDGQALHFNVRRQGSTYIYDNTTPSAPVFYMLDGWQEYSHPLNWTKNFEFEAELFDNNSSNLKIKTEVPAGTVAGDYTSFTSYLGFNSAVSAVYDFTVRATSTVNYYFWVRARSKGGSCGLDVAMDGSSSGSINCISDTNWAWYRINSINSQPIVYNNLSLASHELTITPQNTLIEIDKVLLSTQSGPVYGNGASTCAPPVATITAAGPTTFCYGSNVVLTAALATTYQWSTGASTQSVTVHSTGSYTVTVSNASGMTASSSPVSITEYSLPTATITSNAGDSLCLGATLTLSANTSASYLWSTGSTLLSSLITSSGSYTVTVTNTQGCTKTSSMLIRNGFCPVPASITPNGPLAFCAGGNVVLSANASPSYSWSTGATTQNITATTTGNFTVTVSNGYGQTASASAFVDVNPIPTVSVTSNAGDSLCPGNTLNLTSTTNATYLWSTGAIVKTIIVSAPGTYTVTSTNNKGCTATASFVVRQGYCPPAAAITPSGPTQFCSGGSVTLNVNTTNNCLWSNGSTAHSRVATTTGNYTVTVTNTYGQTTSASILVTANANPTAAITSNAGDSLCPGGSLTLTSATCSSYLWSTSATTKTLNVSAPSTYIVTATNSNGCSASATCVIRQGYCPPSATISVSGPTTFCSGGNVTLSINTTNNCMWSNGSTAHSLTAATSGTYTLTVTNSYGQTATSSVAVNVNATPSVSISSNAGDSLCPGGAIVLQSTTCTSYLWTGGNTASNMAVSTPGTYTVTVTNASGCTTTGTFKVRQGYCPPAVVITPSGPTQFCSGGSVTLTVNTTNNCLWSNGSTAHSRVATTTGNYTVTVTNSYGQTKSASILVTANANPVASITSNAGDSLCPGSSLTLTSGTCSQYLWSNAASTKSTIVSLPGTYTITATNQNGCSASASFNVRQGYCPPAATITANGATTFCSGGNVVLSVNTINNCQWSNGSTAHSLTATATGNYTVTVTNSYGQTTSASIAVTANPYPAVSVSSNAGDSLCPGGSLVLQASSGNSYQWTGGNTNNSLSVSSTGTYTVTVTNTSGCSSTSSFVVRQGYCPPSVSITANGTSSFCNGGSVVLSANASTGCLWSNGSTSQDITATSAGNYTVTITNSYGQTASASIAVSVNPYPTVSISSNAGDSLCPGGSLALQSTAGSSYQWSNGNSSDNITVSAPGTYTVTVTNVLGCSSSSSFVVRQGYCPPSVSITANSSTSFCIGGSVTLNASTSANCLWSDGSTSQSITVTTAGNYTVTATNSYGQTSSASVAVSVNTYPVVSISSNAGDSLCPGGSLVLQSTGNGTFQWSDGSSNDNLSVSATGTYTVTVTNASGCSSSSSFTVRQGLCGTTASISANGSTVICSGSNVVLTANTANVYQWSDGSTSQSIVVSLAGTYTVTVTDSYSQTASASIGVTVNISPSVSVNSNSGDTLCPGTSLTLQAVTSDNCLWSNGSTSQSIVINSAGTYIVTVTNSAGCTATAIFVAKQGTCSSPNAAITSNGNTTFCKGDSVQLSALPGYSYIWSNGKTSQAIIVKTSGAYKVTVTNWYGATASSPALNVTVNNPPVAVITSNGALTICTGDSVTLTSGTAPHYMWSNGASTKSITVTQTGSYSVVVTSNKGCSAVSNPANVNAGFCNPTCAPPHNLSHTVLSSTSVKLKWTNTSTPDSIRYTYTNMTTGISVTKKLAGSKLTVTVNGLSASTVYKWSLKSVCGGVPSAASDTLTFTTLTPKFGEEMIAQDMNVYPNPGRENLNISFNADEDAAYNVIIRDITGKLVYQMQYNAIAGENTPVINIENLKAGTYFAELQGNNEMKHKMFVKQQ